MPDTMPSLSFPVSCSRSIESQKYGIEFKTNAAQNNVNITAKKTDCGFAGDRITNAPVNEIDDPTLLAERDLILSQSYWQDDSGLLVIHKPVL